MSSQQSRPSAAQSLPTRNPRRRTRQEIDGGASSLRPTRSKRSKLDDGSSLHRHSNGQPSQHQEPYMNGTNGHALAPAANGNDEPVEDPVELAVHPKPTAAQRRSLRDENANILAKTECYQAAQLPGTPDELHDKEEDFNGMALPSASLALAITADKAYVWNYTHSGTASALRDFTLPYPSRAREPLPIATLVKQAAKGDTGLVVISAHLGKITFWENIDNAAALSLFEQKRNGTEGDVGGMFSGETVTEITSADPAGYLLTFSSGRVAQLSLWDSQSRPSISVRFLKSSAANKGYFGGIWKALGVGGYLKDVVAVRSQMSRTRGLADVLVFSETAKIQYWQLGWSTQQPLLVKEIDAINALQESVSDRLHNLPSAIQSVQLVDCVIASSDNNDGETVFKLVCLGCVLGASFVKYVIAELTVNSNGSAEGGNIYPLDSYAAPLTGGHRWQARLSYPSRSSTIFVVFEKAVTVFCPKSGTFQDTIYLKQEEDVHITGVNAEAYDERKQEAAAIIHVRGNGPVRISVHEDVVERSGGRLSARTQIEQAVFYGTRPLNPFDLGRTPEMKHPQEEVEKAVLGVSNDILGSRYPTVLPAVKAMDYDIQRRSQALENLAKHIKHVGLQLSRRTKWMLLWEAEKLAAARRLWVEYDQSNTGNANEVRLLPELIEYLHPLRKSFSEELADQLRQFLRYDVNELQQLLPFTYIVIYQLAQRSDVRDSDRLLQVVCDGGDLIKDALGEAFTFRERNLWLYGLENEKLAEGVLIDKDDYRGLPEFWTSTHQSTRKIREFIENAQTAAIDDDDHSKELVAKIALDNPIVLREWSKSVEERYKWCITRDDARIREAGQKEYDDAIEGRSQILIRLAELRQIKQGLDLAQKYGDMSALSKLISLYATQLNTLVQATLHGPLDETAAQRSKRLSKHRKAADETTDLEARIASLCDQLGSSFSHPYFADFMRAGLQNSFLTIAQSYPAEAKEFLQSDGSLRKYAWMNDIINEKDYASAAKNLTLAVEPATDSYDKKVIASFSKLALLAATEAEVNSMPLATYYMNTQSSIDILDIQQTLFDHIQPIFYGCVDQDAELEQLMAELANTNVARRNSIRQLFERNLGALIKHEALAPVDLADVLSLMDANDLPSKHGLALHALLAASGLAGADEPSLEFARRMVWRRSYIEDDWPALTSSKRQNDEQQEAMLRETVLFSTMVECLETGVISATTSPPKPQALLQTGTTAESWQLRFAEPTLCKGLASDTTVEADKLSSYIDACDIDSWVTTAYELAKQQMASVELQRHHEHEALQAYGDEAMRFETGREESLENQIDEEAVVIEPAEGAMEVDVEDGE